MERHEARSAARKAIAGPVPGAAAEAMAAAVKASECNDANTLTAVAKWAEDKGIIGVDVSKALHADLLDVVGIEPGGAVSLGAWLTKAGSFVRSSGGMTVTEKAKLDAEVPA